MGKPHYESKHRSKKAMRIFDPLCFTGKASDPKFKVNDRVRIRNLPDVFYSHTQTYMRGAEATVVRVVYESQPAEDRAWHSTENVEWRYSLVFKQKELWPDYSDTFSQDTLETEIPEHWLEPV